MTENKISSIRNLSIEKTDTNVKKNDTKKAQVFSDILSKEILERKNELEFSGHAVKRLSERNLNVDAQEFLKLKDAVNALKDKGSKDSLIITEKAAYIVDVDNAKVVTAIDKENIKENVFTKIDSTIILN